jgi:NAD(P)-dependent dehydrogenase (short-subunit alcohol dehydrogenase family)
MLGFSSTNSSSARTVGTAAAIVVGAAYIFHRSIPTLMTIVTKFQMNPPDDEIGQIIDEQHHNDITYEELADLGVIKGKSALIVGGTRGVGFGTSMALAQAGAARVTLVGRNEANGNKAVSKIKKSLQSSSSSSSSQFTKVTFLQGDIGTVASTKLFLKKLQHDSESDDDDDDDDKGTRYDYLIVTAAIFPQPKKRNPKPLNEDGVEKSFGIGVVGRFLLYHSAHTFMEQPTEGNSDDDGNNDNNNSPIILNVCASGGDIPRKFNRELVRSLGYSHIFNIMNFAIGNELMLRKLVEEDNCDGKKFDIPVITTHPGFLKTDLHRGQGILMDIAEGVLVHFLGSTEEECGRRQVSILCALADNKFRRSRRSLLSMVDNFGQGRLINKNTEQDLYEHGNWLWNLLLLIEKGCKINDASFVP